MADNPTKKPERCERKLGDLVVVLGAKEFAAVEGMEFVALKYFTDPTRPAATAVFGSDKGFRVVTRFIPLEVWQERENGERVLIMRPMRMAKIERGDF